MVSGIGDAAASPSSSATSSRPGPAVVRQLEEPGQVVPSAEVVLTATSLVDVPRDIRLDRVESQGAQPSEPVGPQIRVDPEVVDGAGDDPVRPTVAEELVAVHEKGGGHGGSLHAGSHGLSNGSGERV
jgi:hypothetical protein